MGRCCTDLQSQRTAHNLNHRALPAPPPRCILGGVLQLQTSPKLVRLHGVAQGSVQYSPGLSLPFPPRLYLLHAAT